MEFLAVCVEYVDNRYSGVIVVTVVLLRKLLSDTELSQDDRVVFQATGLSDEPS